MEELCRNLERNTRSLKAARRIRYAYPRAAGLHRNPKVHAGHEHADTRIGFDCIQRRQGIFKTGHLATSRLRQGQRQFTRVKFVVNHKHGRGPCRRFYAGCRDNGTVRVSRFTVKIEIAAASAA